jgi:molybdenum cofactor cytidylyltransferase
MSHKSDIQQKKSIALVILAAGKSSRMGAVKQNLPWKDSTLLVNAIETGLKSNADAVFVVLGANSEIIHPFIKHLDIGIIENRHWMQGLGSSISSAVSYIVNTKNQYDSVLFCLADMPFVKSTHLNCMMALFQLNESAIIATTFKDKPVVPVLFNTKYFKELMNLSGDTGAKEVLKKHSNKIKRIEVSSTKTLIDLDTKSDYNLYKNS